MHLQYQGDYCALRTPGDEKSVHCKVWSTAHGWGPGEGICHREDIKLYRKKDLYLKIPATTGRKTAPQRSGSAQASDQLEGRSTGVTNAPRKKTKGSRATPPNLPSNEVRILASKYHIHLTSIFLTHGNIKGSYVNFQANYQGGVDSSSRVSYSIFDSKQPHENARYILQPQPQMPIGTVNNGHNPGVYHHPAESFPDATYHHPGYASFSRQPEGYLGDTSYGSSAYNFPSLSVPTYNIPKY